MSLGASPARLPALPRKVEQKNTKQSVRERLTTISSGLDSFQERAQEGHETGHETNHGDGSAGPRWTPPGPGQTDRRHQKAKADGERKQIQAERRGPTAEEGAGGVEGKPTGAAGAAGEDECAEHASQTLNPIQVLLTQHR
jgi:hypothetical protein